MNRYGMLVAGWVLFGLVGVVGWDPHLAADPPKPPVKEEEEDPPQPPRKPIEEEEEDPAKKPKSKPPSEGPFDLAEEAAKLKDLPEKYRELLRELAVPFDLVVTKGATKKTRWRAEPIAKRFDPESTSSIVGFRAVEDGKPDNKVGPVEVPRSQIESVEHYEDRVLREAAALAAKMPGEGESRFQLLRLAEMLLEHAHRFHTEAKKREGEAWKPFAAKLADELRKVRFAEIRALVEGQPPDLDLAEAMAERLYARYQTAHRDLLDAIESIFLARALAAFQNGRYHRVHQHLKGLERYPGTEDLPNVERFRKRLQEQAAKLKEQAESKVLAAAPLLEKDETRSDGRRLQGQALALFQSAERCWPKLPGVREARIQMEKTYPILRVGVRHLPLQMSPTTADSDADRMAMRLIFDRLLQLRSGPSARDGYLCKLGFELKSSDGGWEITLPAELKWSDGTSVTTEDFLRSFDVAGDPRSLAYHPLAAGRDGLLQLQVDDKQRARVTLKRSFLDPPALLTFDLVPKHLLPADVSPRNTAFGKRPIGTGPYAFISSSDEGVVLAANPYYRRPHAPNGPAIQEIHLVRYGNADELQNLLQNEEVHMALEVRTQDLPLFKEVAGTQVVTLTEPSRKPPHLANPRIYFLGPNFRLPEFQNEDLRIAMGMAIHREEILRQVFRGTDKAKYHHVLNGPFPLGSWAYHPDYVPERKKLYNPDEAKNHLADAARRIKLRPFNLHCPAEDEDAVKACERIKDQLEAIGLTLTVVKLPRHQLSAELAKENPDFDLVYASFDFENETLSLWPLFDPRAIGKDGRNFMAYSGDAELETLMRGLHQRRDFETVRLQARELHEMMMKKMVLIPLWQLDRHAIIPTQLKFAPGQARLHPLDVFDNVEQWQLQPKD